MRYFWGLDLIRFLSAAMVVFFHMYAFAGDTPAWPSEATSAPFAWLSPYAWMGWIGVQIFFVLSGFVISASALNSTALSFIKKRAIRLLPTLWISSIIALAARLYWGEPLMQLLQPFLKSLFLVPKGPYIDGVVWTLVVEAIFYATTAIVLLVSARVGGQRKALRYFAYALGGASSVFTLIHWGNQSLSLGGSLPLGSFAFDVALLRQGLYFSIGMLLFQMVDTSATRKDWMLVAFLSSMAALQIFNTVGDAWAVVPIAIWGFATALVYLGAKYGDKLVEIDLQPIMRPIGLMTYPLYLNHFVLGQALLPLLTPWIHDTAVLFTIFFGLLLANAWAISHYPERFIQKTLKKAMLGQSAQPAPPANQVIA